VGPRVALVPPRLSFLLAGHSLVWIWCRAVGGFPPPVWPCVALCRRHADGETKPRGGATAPRRQARAHAWEVACHARVAHRPCWPRHGDPLCSARGGTHRRVGRSPARPWATGCSLCRPLGGLQTWSLGARTEPPCVGKENKGRLVGELPSPFDWDADVGVAAAALATRGWPT